MYAYMLVTSYRDVCRLNQSIHYLIFFRNGKGPFLPLPLAGAFALFPGLVLSEGLVVIVDIGVDFILFGLVIGMDSYCLEPVFLAPDV